MRNHACMRDRDSEHQAEGDRQRQSERERGREREKKRETDSPRWRETCMREVQRGRELGGERWGREVL